jgi:hypothetical protein
VSSVKLCRHSEVYFYKCFDKWSFLTIHLTMWSFVSKILNDTTAFMCSSQRRLTHARVVVLQLRAQALVAMPCHLRQHQLAPCTESRERGAEHATPEQKGDSPVRAQTHGRPEPPPRVAPRRARSKQKLSGAEAKAVDRLESATTIGFHLSATLPLLSPTRKQTSGDREDASVPPVRPSHSCMHEERSGYWGDRGVCHSAA